MWSSHHTLGVTVLVLGACLLLYQSGNVDKGIRPVTRRTNVKVGLKRNTLAATRNRIRPPADDQVLECAPPCMNVVVSAHTILIQSNVTLCERPFYMARGIGQRLVNLPHRQTTEPSIYELDTSGALGQFTIDITLITCQMFSTTSRQAAINMSTCVTGPPKSVFQSNLTFKGKFESDEVGWHLKTGYRWGMLNYNVRYQLPDGKCAQGAQVSDCDRSVEHAYEYISKPLAAHLQNPNLLLCFVGASHARVMSESVAAEFGKNRTKYYGNRLVEDLAVAEYKYLQNKCNYTIATVGQWDLSLQNRGGIPSLKIWKERMEKAVATANKYVAVGGKVVFVSTDYNPMGKIRLTCPPTDWRNPDIIEAYNHVTETVCRVAGFPFVNNNRAIVGPVWDGAPDWNHMRNHVFLAGFFNVMSTWAEPKLQAR
eukprot:m.205834 g.205834  ORF g.205834 m.205834 type:complete len:426 (+) comp32928_c0_seq1:412-1689(+)